MNATWNSLLNVGLAELANTTTIKKKKKKRTSRNMLVKFETTASPKCKCYLKRIIKLALAFPPISNIRYENTE